MPHTEYDITLESSVLTTIKVWLNLIPSDKVIERDIILASVTDAWVTFGEVEEASKGLFTLVSSPTKIVFQKKLKDMLKVSPEEFHSFVSEVNVTLGETVALINDNVPRYTVKDEMTIRQACILEFSRDIVQLASVLSSFIVNFTYLADGQQETKEREKIIKTATPMLRRAIKDLKGNYSKHVKSIKRLSNTLKVMSDLQSGNTEGVRLGVNNFGNPIWSLRKFFVDRDKNTFDKLKTEAQLIEIRIIQIQSESSPNIEERVEYFEQQLASISKKMKALERQYG